MEISRWNWGNIVKPKYEHFVAHFDLYGVMSEKYWRYSGRIYIWPHIHLCIYPFTNIYGWYTTSSKICIIAYILDFKTLWMYYILSYLDFWLQAYPQEKVGVFVRRGKGGPLTVMEYSEMDSSLASAINQQTGRLRFCWSNVMPIINLYVIVNLFICIFILVFCPWHWPYRLKPDTAVPCCAFSLGMCFEINISIMIVLYFLGHESATRHIVFFRCACTCSHWIF